MLNGSDLASMVIFLGMFLGAIGTALLVLFYFKSDRQRAVDRLRELSEPEDSQPAASFGELGWSAFMQLGDWLMPGQEKRRAKLAERFTTAGIYRNDAPRTFLAVQMVSAIVLPLLAALVPYLCGLVSLRLALALSAFAAAAGVLLPRLWLNARRNKRQTALRQGLPDAVDMLVLCLEGGISLSGAIQRVTQELWAAHPLLAAELGIAQREVDMGLSAGESLRKIGERCGVEEIRELAAVLLQSERFGAGAVKSLRVHAEGWRQVRQQRLEELAQKASVKILFPTLLCIFPAVFIVTLGPAAQQIARMFK